MHFSVNVPASTEAYAVTISDRLINLSVRQGKNEYVDLSFFPLIKMIKIEELKTLLKENKINFYTYWNKKRLIALANEHDRLPKMEVEKEKSKDAKYDRLKTIRQNPRKVMLEDVETGETKTFPSVYKAAQFIDQTPQTITYWAGRKGAWNNKYKVVIE